MMVARRQAASSHACIAGFVDHKYKPSIMMRPLREILDEWKIVRIAREEKMLAKNSRLIPRAEFSPLRLCSMVCAERRSDTSLVHLIVEVK